MKKYFLLFFVSCFSFAGVVGPFPPVAGWKLNGNAGTNSGPQFIGTTDNQALELHTNATNRMKISANGWIEFFPNEMGIKIDQSAINTGVENGGLEISNGQLRAQNDYQTENITTPDQPIQLHSVGGTFHVNAGHPVTGGNFAFGNLNAIAMYFQDDMPADITGIGLGFVSTLMGGQLSVASGKTAENVNFAMAGAGVPAVPDPDGGTVANLNLFYGAGLLPQGGSVTATNLTAFKSSSIICLLATNCWGVNIPDTSANNYFAKNLVIGGSTGLPTGSYALDVTGDVIFGTIFSNDTNASINANVRELYNSSGNLLVDFFDESPKLPQGVQINTTSTQPACDASHRGLMWNIEGGAGVADIFQVCQKDAADNYNWVTH